MEKKTIAPDHVFRALTSIHFNEYIKEVSEANDIYLKECEEKSKVKNKHETPEELEKLEALQKQLFDRSRSFSTISRVQSEDLSIQATVGNLPVLMPMQSDSGLLPGFQASVMKAPKFKEEDNEDYEDF